MVFYVIVIADINECRMFPDLCLNGLCQNKLKSGYRCICDKGFQNVPGSETKCVGELFIVDEGLNADRPSCQGGFLVQCEQ